MQDVINEALRSENANASGGVTHPPFHFDYIEVKRHKRVKRDMNAHAFQSDGFSFIVVTLPLVELLWDLSQRLANSQSILQLLGIDQGRVPPDTLQLLLFQLQLTFLVSHEYTHHIHRHCRDDQTAGAWKVQDGGARSHNWDGQIWRASKPTNSYSHVFSWPQPLCFVLSGPRASRSHRSWSSCTLLRQSGSSTPFGSRKCGVIRTDLCFRRGLKPNDSAIYSVRPSTQSEGSLDSSGTYISHSFVAMRALSMIGGYPNGLTRSASGRGRRASRWLSADGQNPPFPA